MSQYRRILMFASPEMRRTAAFERAVWLAKTTGATLHFSLPDYDGGIAKLLRGDRAAGQRACDAFLAQRRAWLEAECAVLRADGLAVTGQVSWAHPLGDEMLAEVAEFKPDLVVKDAHHEPLLRRLLLTPLDWQLLRECPAPLLLVGKLAHAVPRRMLVAVDVGHGAAQADDLNARILREALAMAIQCDAELHLAYVFQAVPEVALGDFTGEFYAAMQRVERDAFQALATRHGVPPERAHFLLGPPAPSIVELAGKLEADVVVVGSAHHRGLDRLILGSTATAVLERASCDVLAIRPA